MQPVHIASAETSPRGSCRGPPRRECGPADAIHAFHSTTRGRRPAELSRCLPHRIRRQPDHSVRSRAIVREGLFACRSLDELVKQFLEGGDRWMIHQHGNIALDVAVLDREINVDEQHNVARAGRRREIE